MCPAFKELTVQLGGMVTDVGLYKILALSIPPIFMENLQRRLSITSSEKPALISLQPACRPGRSGIPYI